MSFFDVSVPPQVELGLGARLEYKGLLLNNLHNAGFQVSDISGLQMWLKPESLSSGSISSWTDSSGLGNHATQGTGANQPTVQNSAINGYKAARFDGANDTLGVALGADASRTYFVVTRVNTLSDSSVLGWGNNFGRLAAIDGSTTWKYGVNEATSQVNLGGTVTNWNLLTLRLNSASSLDAYLNGDSATSFDPSNLITTATNLTIGGRGDGGAFLNGDVAEVIVFNTALSNTDRDKVLGYLSNKYPTLGSFGTSPAGGTVNADVYRIMRMDGVGGLPDIRDSREINPSRHGETSLSSYFSGRPIVLDGRIEAGNLPKLRAMEYALRSAFSSLEDDWLYFHAWGDSSLSTRIKCRTTGFSIAESQDNKHYRRNFQITMRAPHPFFTSVASISDEEVFLQTTAGTPNPITLTNNGNFQAYPVIRITGPVTNPVIKNLTNNLQMTFTGAIATGTYVDVDVKNRTIIDSTGANRFALLNVSSDWIVLEPGANTIDHYASIFTGVGKTKVTIEHTWV